MDPTPSNKNTNVRPCSMAKQLVPDELWMVIDPLLPPEPNGGRPRVPNRTALAGVIYVLKSGIPWGMVPKELGSGTGRKPECGIVCTTYCWTNWAKPD
jgi:hypothetical protein